MNLRNVSAVGCWLLLLLSHSLLAHHSFAPHFDADKPVVIIGEIIKFEQRNPHAYLHVRAQDADGRSHDWRCESHGVTMLTRNGITPELLRVGSTIHIEGSQHRRDPYMCFFDSVHLADGSVLNVNGQRGDNSSEPVVSQRDSVIGTWLLVPARRATSGPQFMMDFLTPAGRAAVQQYNPFTDDPTYRCEPVAIRRAWFAPGTPMAIRQQGEDLVIEHEWMDVQRIVHMNLSATPANQPTSILGYSRGRWEGESLIVETDNYTPGVLSQFVNVAGEPMRGLLHSDQLTTLERITFLPDSNRIHLQIAHQDAEFFSRDFPLVDAEYAASDLQLRPFGCIPEQLK